MRFIFLFAFCFSFSALALVHPCQKSMILRGASEYASVVSSVAQKYFYSPLFYDLLLPVEGEEADFTVVLHDVSVSENSEKQKLELICDLELIGKNEGSLGRKQVVSDLAFHTNEWNQAKAMERACKQVVKSVFSKVPMCHR
jgi:hypothetical protein